MKKRVLSVWMAIILTIAGINTGAVKSQAKGNDTAEQVCNILQLMNTDESIPITDESKITRAEFAQILLNFSVYKGETTISVSSYHYSDVSSKYWAAKYIEAAASEGWMMGYLNGTFKPKRKITLKEAVYGVLKVLGYEDSDFTKTLSTGVMKMYRKMTLNKKISLKEKAPLTGIACKNLLYNAMIAKTKEGKVYAEVLGYAVSSDGELDYSGILTSALTGPMIVKSNWKSTLPFSAGLANYYKNDQKCTATDIKENDIMYYSKVRKTVWAYDYKISGSLDAVNKDEAKSVPASIKLAGSEEVYPLGTSDAVTHFAITGNVAEGDLVTLLLDKDKKTVVSALKMADYDNTFTGIIIKCFSVTKTVENGKKRLFNYITMVNTLGQELSIKYSGSKYDYYVGEPVEIICSGEAPIISQIEKADYETITGVVDTKGSMFNGAVFAKDASILDIKGSAYKLVDTDRIADTRFQRGNILFMNKNEAGEISELFLNNITGDLDSYGIISTMDYNIENLPKIYYDINGKSGEFDLNTVEGNMIVDTPVKFEMEDGEILRVSALFSLGEIKYNSVGSVVANNTMYKLADDLVVYKKVYNNINQKNTYKCIPFSSIGDTSDCIMTGYYDKRLEEGGRIRVIIVTKK
jgi:hypothetical protein